MQNMDYLVSMILQNYWVIIALVIVIAAFGVYMNFTPHAWEFFSNKSKEHPDSAKQQQHV